MLQQEVGNFSVKRVMVRVGIQPSISTATLRRVMGKTGLKWSNSRSFPEKFVRNHQKTFGLEV